MEVFVDNNQVLLKTYIDSILGNLDNLPLTDKSSLESCLMGILNKIDNITIPLSNSLTSNDTTTAASSKAVYELNLLLEELKSKLGDLGSSTTTDKTNLVSVINEVSNNLELQKNEIIQIKPIVNNAYKVAQDTQIELKVFKASLLEGFTANQFSDSFNTLDAFEVTQGYYNQPLSRLEV